MHNKIFIFTIIFTIFILAQTGFAKTDSGNQNGRFIGELILEDGETLTKHGEWWYDEINIKAGTTLYVTAYDGDEDKGKIIMRANKIQIDGTIDAKGKGYRGWKGSQGQGGGGGGVGGYMSSGFPGSGGTKASNGTKGEGDFGGNAGYGTEGESGTQGEDGHQWRGGQGGHGGISGAIAGNGGYLAQGLNGDTSVDTTLTIGSAGGAGGGGAGGGGGGGGSGGNDSWPVTNTGGDGGYGGIGGDGGLGGNGGGCIRLFANKSLLINGIIDVSGNKGKGGTQGNNGFPGEPGAKFAFDGGKGGRGGNGGTGGNGAGGGSLLYCPENNGITISGNIDARGGEESSINGGTVKIFYRSHPPSTCNIESGRLFKTDSYRKATVPELTTPSDVFTSYQAEIDLGAIYQSPDLYNGKIYFQIATDNTFYNIIFDTLSANLVASGTEVKIATSELSPDTYYWRAQNVDSLGLGSDHSEVRSFEVLDGVSLTPGPVSTVTPAATPIRPPAPDVQIRVFPSRINPEKGEYASIRWCQNESCPATLKLYNLLGELVKTLADNIFYSRGQEHEVIWRGVNAAGATVGSGIYIVHIKAGNWQDRVKIAVVK